MEKKLMVALALYALIALMAGITLGDAGFRAGGNYVELRVCVWILLLGLAAKTWIGFKAGL